MAQDGTAGPDAAGHDDEAASAGRDAVARALAREAIRGEARAAWRGTSPRAAGPPDGFSVIADADLERAIAEAALAGDPEEDGEAASREEQTRLRMLRRLIEDPLSRWRPVAIADAAMLARLDRLAEGSPNFAAPAAFARRAIGLSLATRTPLRLPPILLGGSPGIGKTRFARSLAEAMGADLTVIAGTLLSDRGAITGLNPAWRGARVGAVARAVLASPRPVVAILLDEVEKCVGLGAEDRPQDALLPLLEPDTARAYVDDYLGVPMRADGIAWIMTANDPGRMGAPLRDRLIGFDVPEPTPAERRRIDRQIFRETDGALGGGFKAAPGALEGMAGLGTRRAKAVLRDAFAHAARAGRRTVTARDVEDARRAVDPAPVRAAPPGFRIKPL